MLRCSFLKPILATLPPGAGVLLLRGVFPESGWVGAAVGLTILVGGYLSTLVLLGLEEEDRAQIRRLRAALP